LLQDYQKKLIQLYAETEINSKSAQSNGDKCKVRADHLQACIEIELEESIRVVSNAINGALGEDYARKNPRLISELIPNIQNDVRQYVQDFAAQFNVKPSKAE